MKIKITKFKDLKIIYSPIHRDRRGYFREIFQKKILKQKFLFTCVSSSKKNVLRGLHYDNKTWKLISCPYGKIFFVVVNCNSKSKDYLKYKSWILDQKKNVQILVPPMFANGHLCLSDSCLFHYKLSYKGKYFDIDKQKVLKWNDVRVNIKWPIKSKPIMSKRDE